MIFLWRKKYYHPYNSKTLKKYLQENKVLQLFAFAAFRKLFVVESIYLLGHFPGITPSCHYRVVLVASGDHF